MEWHAKQSSEETGNQGSKCQHWLCHSFIGIPDNVGIARDVIEKPLAFRTLKETRGVEPESTHLSVKVVISVVSTV